MLNQIQLHVHEDEEQQLEVEKQAAHTLRSRYHENVEAFRRHIPSLLSLVDTEKTSNSTILCNKHGELNVVNVTTGQVLYGLQPLKDVSYEVKNALQEMKPIYFDQANRQEPDVLVIFGLGLGYHIPMLLQQNKFRNIVIYEPDPELFVCSLSVINWKHVLESAKQDGVGLFLQIGDSGKQLYENMSELQHHLGISGFYYYKHLNNHVFDDVEFKLRNGFWSDLKNWKGLNSNSNSIVNYLPLWTKRYSSAALLDLENQKFKDNLNALRSYFPAIYDEFKDYSPSVWAPYTDESSHVNLAHKNTRSLFYHYDPVEACEDSFHCFAQRPHKDGIVLGYKGKKLRNYLHYQMVLECEGVLNGVKDETGLLPETVKSVIFFGLAAGYDLSHLVDNYDVDKLFICEPNKDFFYASLHALDWVSILDYFSKKERRLYLNIGDDGTNLTDDLLVQFQSIGPYVLANTYFYQSYYNERLVNAISQLREQLQVMIAMGDYFDNARFGTAHTHWAIQNNIPFLKKRVSAQLSVDNKDVPIFIVGNGPSLDNLLPLLKEEGHKGIIVSCGTALQTLHAHDIVPDFHAEIEANRSTYDWAVRINDADYLKKITLISCNGIHPDTCELYKDVLLAFKQGEASTVSIFELYDKNDFAALNSAYPTVTNFAVNFFTEIGFTQYYLLGTDLGFVDENHHHSKASGYYNEAGEQLYDYTSENNTSMVVPGNFRPHVKTKYEFKVSKSVLENTLVKKRVDAYNLNDGARIAGARPLDAKNAIVTCSEEDKKAAIENMINVGFSAFSQNDFDKRFEERFSHSQLISELKQLHESVQLSFENEQQVIELIENQRNILVNSLLQKKSLLFFYLNGTLNYINSSFTKITNLQDKQRVVELSQQLADIWSRYTLYILKTFEFQSFEYDNVTSFMGKRRELLLRRYLNEKPLELCFTNSSPRAKTSSYLSLLQEYKEEGALQFDIYCDSDKDNIENVQCAYAIQRDSVNSVSSLFLPHGNTVYLPGTLHNEACSLSCNDETRLNFLVLSIISGLTSVVIIPKQIYCEGKEPSGLHELLDSIYGHFCYGAVDFLVISKRKLTPKELRLGSGDRLVYIPELKKLDLLGRRLNETEYSQSKQKLVLRGTS
jgi:hypothetical protein